MKKHIKHFISTNSMVNKQRGFTLVELMVALALSLLVVAAAVSALLVSRQGFTSVDAASQLRDNSRFSADFITRLSVQSGYKDVAFVDTTKQSLFKSTGVTADPDPSIFGFKNALAGTATDPLNTTNDSRNSGCSGSVGTDCANGSDILVMRYQTGAKNTESTEVDNAMFNCAGVPQNATPTSSSDVIESMLYVSRPTANSPEPTLMCSYRNSSGSAWASAPTPLVQGVESFQILYGTDGVVPNTVPVAAAANGTAPTAGQPDTIPERYLRADQLTVAGNTKATNENWRRVRSLRIGLIVRGPIGSAQAPAAQRLYPFSPSGTLANPPAAFSSTYLDIANTDTRARQVFTFTVYLHNFQGI